jgi:hypothetical protein
LKQPGVLTGPEGLKGLTTPDLVLATMTKRVAVMTAATLKNRRRLPDLLHNQNRQNRQHLFNTLNSLNHLEFFNFLNHPEDVVVSAVRIKCSKLGLGLGLGLDPSVGLDLSLSLGLDLSLSLNPGLSLSLSFNDRCTFGANARTRTLRWYVSDKEVCWRAHWARPSSTMTDTWSYVYCLT